MDAAGPSGFDFKHPGQGENVERINLCEPGPPRVLWCYDLAWYSACLLRVLSVKAHGKLVAGVAALDIPMLHSALPAVKVVNRIALHQQLRQKDGGVGVQYALIWERRTA